MTHDTAPPSQAEVEAISRELTDDAQTYAVAYDLEYHRDLHWRAALMIARLARALTAATTVS